MKRHTWKHNTKTSRCTRCGLEIRHRKGPRGGVVAEFRRKPSPTGWVYDWQDVMPECNS